MDLRSENERLRKENAQQAEQLAAALDAIRQLTERVRELEAQLGQDSHNSHWPSSRDKGKRQTKSLRQASGKKAGGQSGHPGATLTLQPEADSVVAHRPTTCTACGRELAAGAAATLAPERRQVFDLPPLHLQVTEHRVAQVPCPCCGVVNVGAFPPDVSQPTQYGPEVKGLCVYLNQHQLLPLQRLAQVMHELFGCQLTPGSIVNWQRAAAAAVQPTVDNIKAALAKVRVLHCDETGLYVGGQRHWLHLHATAQLTAYLPHRKRGRAGMEAMGVLPHFTGVAVHDSWSAYGHYTCQHALCNVHHLRELTYIAEEFKQAWATDMRHFLVKCKAAVATARTAGATALPPAQRADLATTYQRIIDDALAANPVPPQGWPRSNVRGRPKKPKARNLAERLDEQRTKVLAFLDDFHVPFDNNLAERDLRMLKVQQKISGCFRSWEGAEQAAALRSYLSTMCKQGHNPLHVLRELFAGRLLAPSLSG
ncbi:MAG: IS66 family transposase [Anaerolineales bacterium]|nr:IS66 family transposase [Anaerolineales bacterium]